MTTLPPQQAQTPRQIGVSGSILTLPPLGEALQRAGLITREQIDEALIAQSQTPNKRIGDILVERGAIARETADFFAEPMSALGQPAATCPTIYYVKAAGLLDDDRIISILQEQSRTGMSFETIAVGWGWLRRETLNYLMAYRETPESRPLLPATEHPSVSSQFKRWLDILGACVGLLLTAILFVPLAIAIKLDSPGPIFFSQLRIGLRGKPFRMWKFRSMVPDAERLKHQVENQAKGFIFKNENDPRITWLGHFLRRTSLDEFPQFWNVLIGHMSLVGTRPPTADEVLQYRPHHWQRLHVKPGITGEWQANGRAQVNDFEDIVEMDVLYQQKWSVLYDLQLIWKTIAAVVKKEGAY